MSLLEDQLNFSVYQGNDYPLTVNIKDINGVTYPITGMTNAWCTVKENLNDTSETILKTYSPVNGITIEDAANGQLKVKFSHSDTNITPGEYWYDVRILIGGEYYTVLFGQMIIEEVATEPA